jgi:hypothetical protein
MPRVSLAFFSAAALYGLIGMSWGMHMGATQDHSMMAAHAHLNLLGWATMAVYGIVYALAGSRLASWLGWTTFALSNLGVILMIPTLALILKYGELPQYIGVIVAGELLTLGGMLFFAVSVWSLLLKSFGGTRAVAASATPAE